MSSQNGTFEGFVPPTKNYFHMPNEWINICADIKNLAELKVVQYVIRHTWGYREYDGTPKTITTDEFMHGRKRGNGSRIDKGTGLSNRSVIDGLRDAVNHGYLLCDVDDADKARIIKSYALKMVDTAESDVKNVHTDVKNLHIENRCEDSSQQMCNIFTSDMKKVHSDCEDSSQRSEKDTLERQIKKDTLERQCEESNIPAPSPESAHAPIDFLEAKKRNTGEHPAIRTDEEDESGYAETVKMPAIPKEATHDTPATVPDHTPRVDSVRSPDSANRTGSVAFPPATEVTPSQAQAEQPVTAGSPSAHGQNDGATTRASAGESRPSGRQPTRSYTRVSQANRSAVVERPQLTLRGQQVHEWMEEIQGTRIMRAKGNVNACNVLGENEDVTQESLEKTWKLVTGLQWVKDHEYPIDVQVLADDESKFNFEKNWPLAKRRKEPEPERKQERRVGDYYFIGSAV